MARNKFIRDYRLTERTDERGKTRRDYAYVGDAYHYVFPADAVRRTKRNLLICCAVGFAAFLGALLPRSAAAYIIYITLPFVFSALPLGIAAEAVLTAPRPDRPMERRQADKLENRLPAAAVFVVILPAVSLIGEGVYALRGGALSGGDALFCLGAAVLAACGVILLIKRRSLETRKG